MKKPRVNKVKIKKPTVNLRKPSLASIKAYALKHRLISVLAVVALVALVVAGGLSLNGKLADNSPESAEDKLAQLSDKEKEEFLRSFTSGQEEIQKNVNNKQYKLNQAILSCDKTCTGVVHLIHEGQQQELVAYRVTDQTKVIKGGQEQDPRTLEQMAQNKTLVTLKLRDNPENTLSEISY